MWHNGILLTCENYVNQCNFVSIKIKVIIIIPGQFLLHCNSTLGSSGGHRER